MTSTTQAKTVELNVVFKALASSHRREILQMLSAVDTDGAKKCCAEEEVCACKISDRIGLSPSTTSHHMSVLRDAGLVTARKDGTWTYYTLQREVLSAAASVLTDL